MNRASRYWYRLKDAESAIQRVRDLHKEVNGPFDDFMCDHCYVDENRYYGWPCPTLLALDGERG